MLRGPLFALAFHDVVRRDADDSSGFPGAAAARYKLEWAEFERGLDALAAATQRPPAHVATARERDWLLTFDDGGSSALEIGQALAERGWVGHFFVTAGMIGGVGFLDEAGIRELRTLGHVVGSHSWSHPERMSAIRPDDARHEWVTSRQRLEGILEEPVTVASLAGGYYTRAVAAATAAAGLETLFTSEPTTRPRSVGGCEVVGRFVVRRGTSTHTVVGLATGAPVPRLRQLVSWNALKAVKTVAGPLYPELRRVLLSRR